jgi:hypothetical protein
MYFLGLTEATTAPRIAARAAERFRCATVGGLAAVCATPRAPSLWRGRAHPLETLLDVQRLIELAAAEGAFVAAAPGAEIAGPAEALAALGEDLSPFADILARFGLSREHQISVTWDARATLRAFAERDAPELALAQVLGRDRFGAAIADAMGAERRRLGDWALNLLQDAAEDLLALPTRDDDQIVNVVAMIAPDGQARLDGALERIDAALPGEPRVRCVGPLPAMSFAVIEVKRADEKALAQARRLLDVAPSASLDALKGAFRQLAKTAHPDAGGDDKRFKALVEARTLLSAFADRRGAGAVASIRIAGGGRA